MWYSSHLILTLPLNNWSSILWQCIVSLFLRINCLYSTCPKSCWKILLPGEMDCVKIDMRRDSCVTRKASYCSFVLPTFNVHFVSSCDISDNLFCSDVCIGFKETFFLRSQTSFLLTMTLKWIFECHQWIFKVFSVGIKLVIS